MADRAQPPDRMLSLASAPLRRYSAAELRDVERYFSPSAILLTDRPNRTAKDRVRETVSAPVIDATEAAVTELDRTTVVTAPDLDAARSLLGRPYDRPVAVVTSFIEQEIDPNTFETTLSGLAEYQSLVRDREDIRTHFTTTLPAGQRLRQSEVPLFGAGFIESLEGSRIPCINVGQRPIVEELDSSKVGIQAIPDIGRSMRRQLERQGCTDRQDILEMEPTDLLALDGFGPYYAARVTAGAHAIERARPLRFVQDPLAGDRRIYVDIETDSLTPQYIWQIGVYDEASEEYHAFVNDDEPGNEAAVVTDFAEWVASNAIDGTFIAWYGKRFDFVHLTDFIDRHAPREHAKAWEAAEKFDLLLDFVKPGVATPARSYKLDVVADRLGYEREYPGLSGGGAAQAYATWRAGGEMDWEKWISYCKDDVMATQYVYDTIAEAELFVDKRELERAYNRSTR